MDVDVLVAGVNLGDGGVEGESGGLGSRDADTGVLGLVSRWAVDGVGVDLEG